MPPFPAVSRRDPCPNFSSYGVIRSNLFHRTGLVPNGPLVPQVNMIICGTNNLIEYNNASVSDDFLRLFGQHNVVRNNFYHDIQYANFSTQPHTDGMQTYDDGVSSNHFFPSFDHNLYECNILVSNNNANSHFSILQNYNTNGTFLISDYVARQNVAIDMGGGITLVDNMPNVRIYNNSFYIVQDFATGHQNDFCSETSINCGGDQRLLSHQLCVD